MPSIMGHNMLNEIVFKHEKREFGDIQRDACEDGTHINLEVPHYLKRYVDVGSFTPCS